MQSKHKAAPPGLAFSSHDKIIPYEHLWWEEALGGHELLTETLLSHSCRVDLAAKHLHVETDWDCVSSLCSPPHSPGLFYEVLSPDGAMRVKNMLTILPSLATS